MERWFADEVYAHDSLLKRHLRAAFPSVRDVDDVVQESYFRIWKARAAGPIRSAKSFLFTVARRVALDVLRRGQRAPLVDVKDLDALFVSSGEPTGVEACDRADQIALLVAAVDALPARCREIFILCHLEGLPQRVVAERLGLAESTVAVQSARGLQRCEAYLSRRLPR